MLLSLGPGLSSAPEGWILVVQLPGFKIVDKVKHINSVYAETHKGVGGVSLVGGCSAFDFVGTTESEILLGKLSPISIDAVGTSRLLNDVHHAAYGDGRIAVANSGCDSIEMFSESLEHLETKPLIPLFKPSLRYSFNVLKHQVSRSIRRSLSSYGASYSHFSSKARWANLRKWINPKRVGFPGKDMREIDMRPHFLHPNHVSFQEGEFLITMLRPGVQMSLSGGDRVWSNLARPHDGIVVGGRTVFTECATSCLAVGETLNDFKRYSIVPDGKHGFVRGIAVNDDFYVVGLSALRGKDRVPLARISLLCRERGDIRETWSVPEEYGRQVYSVVDVTEHYLS